jgi:hypothetical protein
MHTLARTAWEHQLKITNHFIWFTLPNYPTHWH